MKESNDKKENVEIKLIKLINREVSLKRINLNRFFQQKTPITRRLILVIGNKFDIFPIHPLTISIEVNYFSIKINRFTSVAIYARLTGLNKIKTKNN